MTPQQLAEDVKRLIAEYAEHLHEYKNSPTHETCDRLAVSHIALTYAIDALAAQAGQQDARSEAPATNWRTEAAAWLRRKADEQEQTNAAYPKHAAAYESWHQRVRDRRWLADDLDAKDRASPFGLDCADPTASPHPKAQQAQQRKPQWVMPKRWPFIEAPWAFAERLQRAHAEFGEDWIAAVRHVLIERPPMIDANLAVPFPAPSTTQEASHD